MYVTMNNDGNDDITYVQFMKLMCSLKEKDIVRRNSSFDGNLLDMDMEAVKKEMEMKAKEQKMEEDSDDDSNEPDTKKKIESTIRPTTPTKITQVLPLDEAQPKVEMTNIITVNEDEEDTNKEGNTDVTVDVQATTGENDNSDAKVTV